jgi:hypothetical protein
MNASIFQGLLGAPYMLDLVLGLGEYRTGICAEVAQGHIC